MRWSASVRCSATARKRSDSFNGKDPTPVACNSMPKRSQVSATTGYKSGQFAKSNESVLSTTISTTSARINSLERQGKTYEHLLTFYFRLNDTIGGMSEEVVACLDIVYALDNLTIDRSQSITHTIYTFGRM